MKILRFAKTVALHSLVPLLLLVPSLARSSELQTGVVFLNPMGASVAVQNEILDQMHQAGVRIIRDLPAVFRTV